MTQAEELRPPLRPQRVGIPVGGPEDFSPNWGPNEPILNVPAISSDPSGTLNFA